MLPAPPRTRIKGALDPQEFWARGEKMNVDLFDPKWDFWGCDPQADRNDSQAHQAWQPD